MHVAEIPNFPSNSALAEGLRVKLTGGYLIAASGSEDELGTMESLTLAGDLSGTVLPIDEAGVRHMIASEAINLHATVYAAASGKVATTGTLIRGIAMEAASGNNSVIKVMTGRASITGAVARSQLTQDDLAPYPIVNEAWYLFDSTIHAPLGATALSTDDLIYTLGTLGTTAPVITGTDFGGSNATQKARVRVAIPAEYVAGETITLRATAGTLTTIADTSSTIDFSVYRRAAPTVDICATAATSINALTVANKDFTLTPTDCVPGDVLDILMTYAGIDAGNLGVILPTISSVQLMFDIKG